METPTRQSENQLDVKSLLKNYEKLRLRQCEKNEPDFHFLSNVKSVIH